MWTAIARCSPNTTSYAAMAEGLDLKKFELISDSKVVLGHIMKESTAQDQNMMNYLEVVKRQQAKYGEVQFTHKTQDAIESVRVDA